jgi:hypothetical protein
MTKKEESTLENTQQNYVANFTFQNLAGNLNSDCEILFKLKLNNNFM